MNKVWQDPVKRRMLKAQRRSLKATKRRRNYLTKKRQRLIRVSKRAREFNYERQTAYQVKAPNHFSIKGNTDAVFKFIAALKGIKDRPRIKSAFINLDKCTYISSGSIALMISTIRELRAKNISISGSYPSDQNTRTILERSGFFNYVRGKVSEENKQTPNTILQQGTSCVDPAKVAPFVLQAMKFIWGMPYRNPRVQSLLVELMANTINHAYPKPAYSKWHLSIAFNDHEKKVSFTFIDNGQGILKTLNIKFKDRINALLLRSNEDVLSAAFDGKFGSRTKERKRGRGLPNVKKCCSENYIKNLVVITNDVYLDFQNSETKKLHQKFEGTCYYWELDLNCTPWKAL
jgi:hypothetical protein